VTPADPKKEPIPERGRKVEDSPRPRKPGEWDQARINETLDRAGLSGSQLSKKLENGKGGNPSKLQVLRWREGKERVPTRYWLQLDALFGGEQ